MNVQPEPRFALVTRLIEVFGPFALLRVNEDDQGTPLVIIGYDGEITYGPNYTPDDAGIQFWKGIANGFPGFIAHPE